MLRYLFAVFLTVSAFGSASAQEKVTIDIRGVIERPAYLYEASSAKGIVLVPQSGLKADSWHDFATQLAVMNISALSVDSASTEGVVAAINFLIDRGTKEISLVGGSIGGGSILQAIGRNQIPEVKSVILLGTGYGDASGSEGVDKLFIVAENDFFAGRTHDSYRDASEPKKLVLFPGAAHGQELFNGEQKEALETLMFEFVGLR